MNHDATRTPPPLSLAAAARDWDIFSPDWACLSNPVPMELRALCALSVGLHPHFACPDWVEKQAQLFFRLWPERHPSDAEKCKEGEQRLRDFLRRLRIAITELAPDGALPIAEGAAKAQGNTLIGIAAFVEWAKAAPREWTLPDEFRCPQPEEVEQAASVNTWPWGDYESEGLRLIAAVIAKFGGAYNVSPPRAPKNAEVVSWLTGQGTSEHQARSIATLLRPANMPPGPRT